MMIRLARISIFPLKSFDPLELACVRLLESGALEDDRRWALFDAKGRFVNAKNTPAIHSLMSSIDLPSQSISIKPRTFDRPQRFHLETQRSQFETQISTWLGRSCELRENRETGFPDDPDAPGPTVISTATLETVASWFPGMTVDEARLRFRANLEIDGVPAFAEDELYGPPGVCRAFHIGAVTFLGVNPCQRCVVPSREPFRGEVDTNFVQRFSRLRESTLPDHACRERFDHYYRLAINTRILIRESNSLTVGDEVEFPR